MQILNTIKGLVRSLLRVLRISAASEPVFGDRLHDLYEYADRIQQWKQQEWLHPYSDLIFTTKIGGLPKVAGALNLPIVHASETPIITGNFAGQAGKVIIRSRALIGVLDLDNRQVYEACNGILFTYHYHPPGTNGNIPDYGIFASPNIEIREVKQMQQAFSDRTEQMLKQMIGHSEVTSPFGDELSHLQLRNRIVEMQTLAFVQGTQYRKTKAESDPV